jgi:hypothetical protein
MEDRQAPDGTSESVGGEHAVASTDPPRTHAERSRREDSLLRVWQSDVCGLAQRCSPSKSDPLSR